MKLGWPRSDLVKHVMRQGRQTLFTVPMKVPVISYKVSVRKIEAWLQSGGRSPNEQALKVRLRELLGCAG